MLDHQPSARGGGWFGFIADERQDGGEGAIAKFDYGGYYGVLSCILGWEILDETKILKGYTNLERIWEQLRIGGEM